MSRTRWQRIRELFEQAHERSPEEREAFLDAACEDDLDLRADLAALLEAEADAGSLLSAGFDRRAGDLLDAMLHAARKAEEEEGRRIGRYRLLKEVGRGGMGTVYLAERADGQFEQRVALKLIRRGMESHFVVQRFLRERQILARLQHPNIARLYDGGVTDDGRPYFAMEYVEGAPLTAYCDAYRLSVARRLQYFLTAAEAVQYAHRNLVVHRDLKPSNILVTSVSAEERRGGGDVKLLDFGIAKMLEGNDRTFEELTTQGGMHLMTPAYAAPEQVRGEAVTTATDVYALGVILYELLSGHRPYRFSSNAPDVVARTITQEQPERPSTVIRHPADIPRDGEGATRITPEDLARVRGTTPDRLRRQLAGDLDTICLMALRKEPDRRYASVEALAEDIRRHLAGLPVAARPDTLAYRTSTFVRRHKMGVAAVVLAFLSLATGFTTALWQALVARHERNEKQIEATRANVTRDYIVSLFEALDPYEAQGRRFSARELIGPGIERLESLTGQPLERAAVMRVLGEVSVSVGLLATADSLFGGALEIQRALLQENHPDIAATLEGRASAKLLMRAYDETEYMLEQALALRSSGSAKSDPQRLKTLNQLAYLYVLQDRLDDAEATYAQALALRERAVGPLRHELARSLRGMADVHLRRARPEEAMPLLEEALRIYGQTLEPSHSESGRTLFSLAQALRSAGDFARSDSMFQRALHINRRVYGEQHYRTATTLYELGLLKETANDMDAALRYYEEAAAVYDAVLPDSHLHRAYPHREMGVMLMKQGRPERAVEPLRRALAVYRRALPPGDITLLQTQLELAGCLFRTGKYDEAELFLKDNYETLTAAADTSIAAADVLAQSLRGLVSVAEARGQSQAADPFRRALQALSDE